MCPCNPDNDEFASALLVVVALLAGVGLMRQHWTKMGAGSRMGGALGLILLVGVLGYAHYSKDDTPAKRQKPSVGLARAPASRPGIQAPVVSELRADSDSNQNVSLPWRASSDKTTGGEEESVEASNAAFDLGSQVIAYYFHRTMRCHSCLTIEELSKQVIEQEFANEIASGRIEYRAVNTDKPENSHFEDDYKLSVQSLVLVQIENGQVTKWKNLKKVWDLFEDYGAFAEYVQGEVTHYLYPGSSTADTNAISE